MANKLTPMMQQYLDIKQQYRDCILFFRLGDFYEMFFDDAVTASKAMEVTLTGKNCGMEEKAPMCGVPYHAADTYIAKLIEKGYKVAVCEQTEDPAAANGIVKREVIRIVTPGTVVNQGMLDEKENNYLASVYASKDGAALTYCDISTGELMSGEFTSGDIWGDLLNELIRIDVRELITDEYLRDTEFYRNVSDLTDAYLSILPDAYFDGQQSEALIKRQFGVSSLTGIGLGESPLIVKSLGGLLSYLQETQKNSVAQLTQINLLDSEGHMSLDKSAIKNLELTETLFEKKVKGSLLGVLDKTQTAMGSRKLKRWIREPLNRSQDVNLRLNAVEFLIGDIILRNNLREALKSVYDLERLSGRIAGGNANGRDMLALKNSVAVLPELKSDLRSCGSEMLQMIAEKIDTLEEVYEKIDAAITEDPPVTIKEGGLIRRGYSEKLDEIKEASSGSLSWIMNLESAERQRTGIKKLKVGFNKVFGYYIEVSKAQAENVPEDYIRKQTLVNCERYVTPKLKEMESVVLNAESRINSLEYELFTELREYLKTFTKTVQETADGVSDLDVLISFAEVSSKNGYIKPAVDDGDVIRIIGGRHPVIEQTITNGIFVSNNTYVDRDRQSLLLITGPNMAGKSTYMRQTALIVLMAQMGCFVPAESAKIGIVDRIYTRIGASDNLTQGQSTFFVEMSELAYILNTATERSLVILDEIGRGTSTYDGLSIAWAVVDHLCSRKRRIRTLFASHYHELTVLEESLEGFKNLNVSVSEKDGDVVFLHKITEGSASKSYGIHVAKLAGVPQSLLKAAQIKLQELETASASHQESVHQRMLHPLSDGRDSDAETAAASARGDTPAAENTAETQQLSFLTFMSHPAVEMLKSLDLMNITPSGAIAILEQLKEAAEETM